MPELLLEVLGPDACTPDAVALHAAAMDLVRAFGGDPSMRQPEAVHALSLLYARAHRYQQRAKTITEQLAPMRSPVECPECKGSGVLMRQRCPICGGTGRA